MSEPAGVLNGLYTAEPAPLWPVFKEFWEYLLRLKEIPEIKLQEKDVERLSRMVYDQLIQSLLKLVRKLSAFQGQDLICFEHLVQFATALFPYVHSDWFVPWSYTVGKELIVASGQHPDISGFYRLLTIIMRICEQHGYFADVLIAPEIAPSPSTSNNTTGSRADLQMSLNASMDDVLHESESQSLSFSAAPPAQNTNKPAQQHVDRDKELAFVLFTKFLKEVLTLIKQYKDDLLAACLEFVLSMPRKFIDVPSMIPALNLALKLGTR